MRLKCHEYNIRNVRYQIFDTWSWCYSRFVWFSMAACERHFFAQFIFVIWKFLCVAWHTFRLVIVNIFSYHIFCSFVCVCVWFVIFMRPQFILVDSFDMICVTECGQHSKAQHCVNTNEWEPQFISDIEIDSGFKYPPWKIWKVCQYSAST